MRPSTCRRRRIGGSGPCRRQTRSLWSLRHLHLQVSYEFRPGLLVDYRAVSGDPRGRHLGDARYPVHRGRGTPRGVRLRPEGLELRPADKGLGDGGFVERGGLGSVSSHSDAGKDNGGVIGELRPEHSGGRVNDRDDVGAGDDLLRPLWRVELPDGGGARDDVVGVFLGG